MKNLVLPFVILFISCQDESKLPSQDQDEPDFIPSFDYNVYSSDFDYDSEHKFFSYTFVFENKGNIEIYLYIDLNEVRDYSDVFEIGIYTPNGFESYSKTLSENEFEFGGGKVGHGIKSGDFIRVRVSGFIEGNYDFEPTAVRLHNLYMTDLKQDFKEALEYTFLH